MRRRLAGTALLCAAALSVAACGTTDPTAAASSAATSSAGSSGEPTASNSASASTDTGESSGADGIDCAADRTATSTGPVNVTDSFGRTVTLAAPAQRVAVLEWQQIEDALTLCVTPVAVADVAGYTTWDTAATLPAGVVDVGTRGEPNLDALFDTNPDLVIIEAYTAEDEIIGQLEKYGVPVLATKGADAADPLANMINTFELIGSALGREQRAELVVGDFDSHLAEAKQAVAAAGPTTTDFVYFDGWVQGGNVSIRPFGQGSNWANSARNSA